MILTKSYKNKEIHYTDKIITTDGHLIHFEVKGDPLDTPVVFQINVTQTERQRLRY